jgi:nitrogen regulatory protein P-II 1
VQLLVVVLHREELLDDVLSALVELELTDAVVIESRTSLELLERDLPIFAGIRSLIPGGIDFSRLVLCLVEDDELAGAALGAIRELGGDEGPTGEPRNTAVLVPVTGVEHF